MAKFVVVAGPNKGVDFDDIKEWLTGEEIATLERRRNALP